MAIGAISIPAPLSGFLLVVVLLSLAALQFRKPRFFGTRKRRRF